MNAAMSIQGKFCSECGKPAPAAEWTCECGQVNKGKFCSNCGKSEGLIMAVISFKCPNCDGELIFDPSTQKV